MRRAVLQASAFLRQAVPPAAGGGGGGGGGGAALPLALSLPAGGARAADEVVEELDGHEKVVQDTIENKPDHVREASRNPARRSSRSGCGDLARHGLQERKTCMFMCGGRGGGG